MTWNANDHTPRQAGGAPPRPPRATDIPPDEALPSHLLHEQLLDELWSPEASGPIWRQAAKAHGWHTAQDRYTLHRLMTRGIIAQEDAP